MDPNSPSIHLANSYLYISRKIPPMFKKKIGQSTNFTENIAFAQFARTSFYCSAVGGGQTDRRLGEKLTKLG